MADKLATELRSDVLNSVGDFDQTRFKDIIIGGYMMEGLRLILQEIQRQNKYGTIPEQVAKTTIPFAEFSGLNKHDLPVDFFTKIRVSREGFAKPIRITTVGHIEDDVSTSFGTITGAKVGAPVPNSANTGIDDLDTRGDFSGSSEDTYTITIASSTTFNWSSTGGGSASGVTMTGKWQTLDNGVQIRFETATGYTAGDVWTFVSYFDQMISVLELNFDPEEAIQLYWVRRITEVTYTGTGLSATFNAYYLPFYRYYDALKLFVELKLNNHAERNIKQDLEIDNQVIKKILDIASTINVDDDLSIQPRNVSKDFI
jgi:hypothetical protein